MRPSEVKTLLEENGMEGTPNRVGVLEIVGNSPAPLTAQEVYETLSRSQPVNRVTVYRILELLVENSLVERVSGGDRSFRYGARSHPAHPHFYCTQCGGMECLRADSVHLDMTQFHRVFPGRVDRVEVRLDGICKNCLKHRS